MRIFGHRGNSSEAPENTLAAFRSAQALGVAGIEFDVHLSKDGVPVVTHDERLERTSSGKGWVGDKTVAELRQLDMGGWFGPAFRSERMPLFAELLEAFRGRAEILNVELKTNHVPYPGLVPAVLCEIGRQGMERQTIVSSFNHHSLAETRALAPDLPCAPILSNRLLEPWDYARRHGFTALHLEHSQVTPELMDACRRTGIAVRAWTVDDPAVAKRLDALGVEAAITNRPKDLLAALR